jgi:hypothetical protein
MVELSAYIRLMGVRFTHGVPTFRTDSRVLTGRAASIARVAFSIEAEIVSSIFTPPNKSARKWERSSRPGGCAPSVREHGSIPKRSTRVRGRGISTRVSAQHVEVRATAKISCNYARRTLYYSHEPRTQFNPLARPLLVVVSTQFVVLFKFIPLNFTH